MPPPLLGSEGQFRVVDKPGSDPSSPSRVDTDSPDPPPPHLQNGLTTVLACGHFARDKKVGILCVPLFHGLPASKITEERGNVV